MFDKKKIFSSAGATTIKFACHRASVRYGAIVTELKGALGGQVFSSGVSGHVMLTRNELIDAIASGSKLTKADAGRVMNPQTSIGSNATAWRDLTDADRQTWSAAAAQFPFKNRFGMPYTGSGYQLYMSCNANLNNYGLPSIATSPLPTMLIPTSPIVITVGTLTGIMTIVSWDVLAGFAGAVYCTVAQSAGKNFDPGRLKSIKIFPSGAVTNLDITTEYENIFGTIPVHGTMWVRACTCVADAGLMAQNYTAKVVW